MILCFWANFSLSFSLVLLWNIAVKTVDETKGPVSDDATPFLKEIPLSTSPESYLVLVSLP